MTLHFPSVFRFLIIRLSRSLSTRLCVLRSPRATPSAIVVGNASLCYLPYLSSMRTLGYLSSPACRLTATFHYATKTVVQPFAGAFPDPTKTKTEDMRLDVSLSGNVLSARVEVGREQIRLNKNKLKHENSLQPLYYTLAGSPTSREGLKLEAP